MPKAKSYDHEVRWPAMRILAEQGAIAKLCELLQQGEDVYEQLSLHRFALRFLSFRPWANRSLDVITEVCNSGVKIASEAAEDNPDDAPWFREEASQMAYNTALNLGACWNDGFERNQAHFNKGLKLAQLAVELRQSLKKSAASIGVAWNAKGIHELALNKTDDAIHSFDTAKKHLGEFAQRQGAPTTVTPKASYDLLLAYGFLALGKLRKGAVSAKQDLDAVYRTFESLKSGDAGDKENADLGLEQIGTMRQQIGL